MFVHSGVVLLSVSNIQTAYAEVVGESATAEIAVGAMVAALLLVLTGVTMRRRGSDLANGTAVTAAGFVVALLALGAGVHGHGWLTQWDVPATSWIVDHRTHLLGQVAVAVTDAGGPPATAAVGVIVAGLLWWRTRSSIPSIVLLLTVGLAAIACTIIKLVVARDRPPVSIHLMTETDYSFPSGHVTGSATLLFMIAILAGAGASAARRTLLTLATVCLVTVVAVSRLYLGVHWLTDVVAGALLAGLAVTLGSAALRWAAGTTAFDSEPTEDVDGDVVESEHVR
ncbi:phosphatase PAP2 family protein [Actinomycetes bacterium M1A6_2h]